VRRSSEAGACGARVFRRFTHRGATFHVACNRFGIITAEIRRQRRLLERYLSRHPEFRLAMQPVAVLPDAPEVACRMAVAARRAGVGPMAAVAGAMAQLAAEAALAAGANEAIVDNGGDIFMQAEAPVVVVLDAGDAGIGRRLAFRIAPEAMPLSVCSSSARMGHSLSLGRCDLATVVAADAALADAAATAAGNQVKRRTDIERALERTLRIEGVHGAVIAMGDRVGMVGRLPPLVRVDGRESR